MSEVFDRVELNAGDEGENRDFRMLGRTGDVLTGCQQLELQSCVGRSVMLWLRSRGYEQGEVENFGESRSRCHIDWPHQTFLAVRATLIG